MSFVAASWAAPAMTWQVTVVWAFGVTAIIYGPLPLSLSAPFVPFVTAIPAAVSPLTGSLNMIVKLIGLDRVGETGPVTVQVGGTES